MNVSLFERVVVDEALKLLLIIPIKNQLAFECGRVNVTRVQTIGFDLVMYGMFGVCENQLLPPSN